MKKRLIQRLQWYYPTERFNMFFFGGLMVYILCFYPLRRTMLLLYGLGIMVYILYQGQKYWQLKLYRLIGKEFDQNRNLDFFRKSKRINRALIALIPLVGAVQCYLLFPFRGFEWPMFYGVLANGFGILEHINYYYRQLSIDNAADVQYVRRNKRIKVASLAKDLLANEL